MAGPGELYQHDSSNHVWLPDTKQKHDLIATKDDYSRMVVDGLLVEKETSYLHLKVARETIEKHGMPLLYYVDNHSIYRINEGQHKEDTVTQFRRALESIGIGMRYAPLREGEAKGKIEKQFDYFQRRMPFLCEKYHVTTLNEANRILREDVIPYYNERHVHEETKEIPLERWKRAINEGESRLRPVPRGVNLSVVFSLHYPRLVRRDGTIQFQGKSWNVGDFVGQQVTVALTPYKKFAVLKGLHKIWEYHL
jgi:hypothetical protein